ncbi:MAG: roadblock/LC7 domain-containing protein [Nitrospiria bacterium]
MSFQEQLKKMAEKIDDFSGVAIADMDGIIIEEYKVDPSFDLSLLVAEYGTFWSSADKASVSSDMGAVCELCMLTEKATIVLRKVSRDYFLLLVISAEKSFGKSRFYARMVADSLEEEIGV